MTPAGLEPISSEPESDILSIELRSLYLPQKYKIKPYRQHYLLLFNGICSMLQLLIFIVTLSYIIRVDSYTDFLLLSDFIKNQNDGIQFFGDRKEMAESVGG